MSEQVNFFALFTSISATAINTFKVDVGAGAEVIMNILHRLQHDIDDNSIGVGRIIEILEQVNIQLAALSNYGQAMEALSTSIYDTRVSGLMDSMYADKSK